MSETQTLKLRLGDQAERLLSNDAFSEAMQRLKKNYIDKMINTPPEDVDARERAYIAVHVVQRLEDELKEMLNQARAARTMQEMEKDGDRT